MDPIAVKMFSPLKLKGKNRGKISLTVSQIGLLKKGNGIFALKPQGVKKTHEGFVGLSSFGRPVLQRSSTAVKPHVEASVLEDYMRADHPLRQVIIEGNLRVLEESQEMKPVSEKTFRKASQTLIAVFPARPEEKTLLQELDSPLVHRGLKEILGFFEAECVSENTLQDFVIFQKRLRLTGGRFLSGKKIKTTRVGPSLADSGLDPVRPFPDLTDPFAPSFFVSK